METKDEIKIKNSYLELNSCLPKMTKNAYFILKAVFVLKIFKILLCCFGHIKKWLDWKDKVNFKIYYITAWLTNNCNTHIAQYLKK